MPGLTTGEDKVKSVFFSVQLIFQLINEIDIYKNHLNLCIGSVLMLIHITQPNVTHILCYTLGYYMATMMGITTVTISIQVLVLALHHHPPNKHPPRWIRKLLGTLHWSNYAYSATAIYRGDNDSKYGRVARKSNEDYRVNPKTTDVHKNNKYKAQQVIFRNGYENATGIGHLKPIVVPPSGKSHRENTKESGNEFKLQNTPTNDDIKYMANTVHKKENQESIMNEWRDIAKDIDSLFFWLFLVILSLTTVIILGVMPLTQPDPSMDPHSLGLYNV